MAKETNEQFQTGDEEHIPCMFSGFSLPRDRDGNLEQNQHLYLQKLENLLLYAPFTEFQSMRMHLAWLANTLPACHFDISHLAQLSEERVPTEKSVLARRRDKATKYVRYHRISLNISKFDRDSVRVVDFADASFGSNFDLPTQFGHISFFADDL